MKINVYHVDRYALRTILQEIKERKMDLIMSAKIAQNLCVRSITYAGVKNVRIKVRWILPCFQSLRKRAASVIRLNL